MEKKTLIRPVINEFSFQGGIVSSEDELYVVFHIQEWERLAEPVKPGGSSIYTNLFTLRYMLERAREIAKLCLETEGLLKEQREKLRLGKVKVELDHEYVDRAGKVLGVKVEEY